MNEDVLENIYQENLDERIIVYLADLKDISLEEAMELYYKSSIADKISMGRYGIQYLDYKILAQIVCDSE